jgi:hypothetical protein
MSNGDRGDLLDPDVLAESAQRNFDVDGFYGISVFAETAEVPSTDLAATRLAAVPWLVLFTAGDLAAAAEQRPGGPLWIVGQEPAHAACQRPAVEVLSVCVGFVTALILVAVSPVLPAGVTRRDR